jgi:hypothetical protein
MTKGIHFFSALFIKEFITHWGEADAAEPQWVIFWFLPRFYPVQMAAQIITSQFIPICNAKQCEQCRPLTTHDGQVKNA